MMAEKSKALPMADQPSGLDGSMIGDVGFDPLGFSDLKLSDGTPVLGKNGLLWMREAELQHGRLCMLAAAGYLAVDLGLRFPGDQFAAVSSSLAAHNAMVEAGPMKVLLFAVSLIECVKLQAIKEMMMEDSGREPGDYSFDPLNFGYTDKLRLQELKNGRLAMLGFSGMVTQDMISTCGADGGFAALWRRRVHHAGGQPGGIFARLLHAARTDEGNCC